MTNADLPQNILRLPFEKRPLEIGEKTNVFQIASSRPLIGREHDIERLCKHICFDALTAVTGLPGVGKTRLAMAVASDERVLTRFQGLIYWASLGEKPNITDILTNLARLQGISARQFTSLQEEKRLQLLAKAFHTQSCLIVLDDVWNQADAEAFLQLEHCHILLTTRYPVIAASLAEASNIHQLSPLANAQALQLLRILAPQLLEVEPQGALTLAQTVGGLPLALILTGSYINNQAPTGQARRIQAALHRLSQAQERMGLTLPERQQDGAPVSLQNTIAAMIEQLLTNETRSTLYALALLAADAKSFTEETAVRVTNCTLQALDRLLDLGLLESDAKGNYHMHQTIADYGQLQLSPKAKQAIVHQLLAFLKEKLQEPDSWAITERTTIIAWLKLAAELNETGLYIHLSRTLIPLWLGEGLYSLAANHAQQAIVLAQTLEMSPDLPHLHIFLGNALLRQGDYRKALASFEDAIVQARRFSDTGVLSEMLVEKAWLMCWIGNYEQARRSLQEEKEFLVGETLLHVKHKLLATQGMLAFIEGKYAEAEQSCQQAIQLDETHQLQQHDFRSILYSLLGSIEGARGHYLQADLYFQQALEIAEADLSRGIAFFILSRKAITYLNTYPLASLLPLQQTIAETLQNAKEHGELAHCTTLYRVQARIFLALGNIEEANKMIQQGMVFLDSVGALNRKEQLLVTQAQIALACGDLHQASRSRQQAMPHMHQYHHADDLAATLGIQGELALREDQIDQAATFFQQMAELAPVEHCILQAQIHFGNARVAAAQHRIRDARLEAEKSLQILQMLQHHKAEEIETWLQTLPTPLFAKLPFVNRGKRSKKAV